MQNRNASTCSRLNPILEHFVISSESLQDKIAPIPTAMQSDTHYVVDGHFCKVARIIVSVPGL